VRRASAISLERPFCYHAGEVIFMRHLLLACVAGLALAASACAQKTTTASADNPQPEVKKMSSIYDFTMKDIDGKEVKLDAFRGKTLLVVNVASRCGYTPQYEGLEAVYEKYKDKGFVILGFPANNFGAQEPGSDKEIKTFCSTTYGVTFPMFSKISVKGADQHPFYQFLTAKETNPEFSGEIPWNFTKFLVGKDGKIIGRFAPGDEPTGDAVTKAIEKAIG
jgi:glutathione peroxidase